MSREPVGADAGEAGPREGELRPRSLVDLAMEELRAQILSGALEPGERLVEEQLTQRFQISRGPLREALRLLGEQGLVEHLPRRGARVTTYSARDFDELFAVRGALERFALTLISERDPTELDLGGAEAALENLRAAARSGDRLAVNNAHRAFHLALVAAAGNQQLLATYAGILAKLQLYMAANLRREAETSSPEEGVHRHERLLQAVRTREAQLIETELDHHGARRFFH